jgi:very-short-patch-repair endonuclease
MAVLSPVEAVVLHVIQCACQRVSTRAVGWGALVVAMYWLVLYAWGSAAQNETTLCNPALLREALQRFAGPRGAPSAGPTERHRTEALCRRLLEAMLRDELPKCRPKWLVNPTTKRCLELDMYCEARRLAFEYDGAQHDVYTPHYHANEAHFEYRCLLDKLKSELCREHGVTLIRIPWTSVSARDTAHTARFLERLLYTHSIPFRSVLLGIDQEVDPLALRGAKYQRRKARVP